MKKLILLLAIISISHVSTSQIAKDKKLHFGAGLVIGGATNAIVYAKTKNKTKAFVWGMVATSVAGLGKELYDEHTYNGFDSKDLGATILGGLTINITFNILER